MNICVYLLLQYKPVKVDLMASLDTENRSPNSESISSVGILTKSLSLNLGSQRDTVLCKDKPKANYPTLASINC